MDKGGREGSLISGTDGMLVEIQVNKRSVARSTVLPGVYAPKPQLKIFLKVTS